MILALQPCASLSSVTITEGCLSRATGRRGLGMASRATPAGSQCCRPRRPSLLRGLSALLRCTGCVSSAWFGGCRPCAFFSLSPQYRIFHVATAPLFYKLSFALALPEPCNCVHSVPLCVHEPPPQVRSAPSQVSQHAHPQESGSTAPLLTQLCRCAHIVQNFSLQS